MCCYIIDGGKKLDGIVKVSGSKNAALPIISAAILNGGITKLYNIPNIHDTRITLEILKYLGCKVNKNNDKIGKVYIYLNDDIIYSNDIYIEKENKSIFTKIKNIFTTIVDKIF